MPNYIQVYVQCIKCKLVILSALISIYCTDQVWHTSRTLDVFSTSTRLWGSEYSFKNFSMSWSRPRPLFIAIYHLSGKIQQQVTVLGHYLSYISFSSAACIYSTSWLVSPLLHMCSYLLISPLCCAATNLILLTVICTWQTSFSCLTGWAEPRPQLENGRTGDKPIADLLHHVM